METVHTEYKKKLFIKILLSEHKKYRKKNKMKEGKKLVTWKQIEHESCWIHFP